MEFDRPTESLTMQTLLQYADWLIAHPVFIYAGILGGVLSGLWCLHQATKQD